MQLRCSADLKGQGFERGGEEMGQGDGLPDGTTRRWRGRDHPP
jgi:hypothetical protein